jgi:hypothetical protein
MASGYAEARDPQRALIARAGPFEWPAFALTVFSAEAARDE